MLLAGVALVTWEVTTSDDAPSRFEVAVPTAPARQVEPAGAALALRDLERAVADGDADSASDQAATADARELLRALATNAARARITDLSLRYVDELGAIAADGTWSAAVVVEWRFAGFDPSTARTETEVRFAATDDRVRIAGIGGDTLRTPIWMTGPLTVSRTQQTLVLAADPASLDRYAELAARAVPVVGAVVADWDSRLVVEVPADQAALERALDAEPGFYGQIAAVTGSADGSVAADAPVHVYVNPEVFDGLGPRGQEVVLDHETAHVAGDGPISRAPTWLVEGYADYVALRDSPLPLRVTAAQIRDRVQAEGPPASLPGPTDFDTRGPHLGAVYESAWLACRVLADRAGNDAFLRFYEAVSLGSPLPRELQRGFGWSQDDLVAAWQQRLRSLP